ncbi:MAG: cytochrome c-type biogenesis protein CcmH [Kiloniellales bacterium]|nr:cytochrome c-type biogenesis protein CcmH [Kiloniellales bacterium]
MTRLVVPPLLPGLLAALAILAFALAAAAVEPDEILDDPALESRARELSKGIRCLVCQNESIDSSNAELAKDLRVLVRERLVAGDSDREVLDYLVERYGDFVLLNPPFKPQTYLLWFGPAAILLLGGLAVAAYFRQRRRDDGPAPAPASALSAEEQKRLSEILKDDGRT